MTSQGVLSFISENKIQHPFFFFNRSSDQKSYFIEFVFDADVKCSVTIHYKATEDLSTGLAM